MPLDWQSHTPRPQLPSWCSTCLYPSLPSRRRALCPTTHSHLPPRQENRLSPTTDVIRNLSVATTNDNLRQIHSSSCLEGESTKEGGQIWSPGLEFRMVEGREESLICLWELRYPSLGPSFTPSSASVLTDMDGCLGPNRLVR